MGRTLHYKIRPNPKHPLTDKDWECIDRMTEYFKKHFTWTCEQVGFSTLNFHPLWKRWSEDSRLPNDEDGWEFVMTEFDRLREKSLSRLDAIRNLHKRKLIAVSCDNDTLDIQEADGFTKVGGNEWNAFLVTAFIVAVSRLVPNHEIELWDEGRFLRCPLIVENGLAKPDTERMLKGLAWFRQQIGLKKHADTYRPVLEEATQSYNNFKAVGYREASHFCEVVNPAHPEFKISSIQNRLLKTSN